MDGNIAEIVSRLKRNHGRSLGCNLLIGAGCSKTAGIPLAGEIVDHIHRDYPEDYRQAEAAASADYPGCMGRLAIDDRRTLINGYIKDARINWAHIHMARLIKAGFVDHVLTTNFDPLLVKACALFNIFPAVYDMAAMKGFEPQRISRNGASIFHLHGTGSGFFQAHDEAEVNELSAKMKPLFEHCNDRHRPWIVVGYSGQCDPVVEHLKQVTSFDQRLYWVGYMDQAPGADAEPLVKGKREDTFLIGGYHADSFFADLADKVGCPAPPFLDRPFSHLEEVLREIIGFQDKDREELSGYAVDGLARIRRAQHCIEPHTSWTCTLDHSPTRPDPAPASASLAEQVEMRMMAKDWDWVVERHDAIRRDGNSALAGQLAWAYVRQGGSLVRSVKEKTGPVDDGPFQRAYEKYAKAIEIKPDMHAAWSNWGWTLTEQAKKADGPEADALFRQAMEKYAKAIEIKPDMHEAWNNWGWSLTNQAKKADRPEADVLFRQAMEKYAKAAEIKPDKHEAWLNWGWALTEQAQKADGPEVDALFRQAMEKYAKAIESKPDDYPTLNNWANALIAQSRTKVGPEADGLLSQAAEKLTQTNIIQPGKGAYNLACIAALRGKSDECRSWLEDSLAHGFLVDRKHLAEDPDLASVRAEPWFADILTKAKA